MIDGFRFGMDRHGRDGGIDQRNERVIASLNLRNGQPAFSAPLDPGRVGDFLEGWNLADGDQFFPGFQPGSNLFFK